MSIIETYCFSDPFHSFARMDFFSAVLLEIHTYDDWCFSSTACVIAAKNSHPCHFAADLKPHIVCLSF